MVKREIGKQKEPPVKVFFGVIQRKWFRFVMLGSVYFVAALPLLAFAVFAKFNSTKLYEYFNKNKAANERYYKLVDIITKIVIIAVLLYLIIPF